MTSRRRPPGEAVLLLVLLAMTILAVVGIALKFSTDAERTIAVNDWSVARSLYAADAGIRWASARMHDPASFLSRPEFRDPPNPFGSVSFPLPAHRHGSAGPFSGDPDDNGIRVTVQAPSFLGGRPDAGEPGQYDYAFEIRVRAAENAAAPRFVKELVADVEIGPLPADFSARLRARSFGAPRELLVAAGLRGDGPAGTRGWARTVLGPVLRGAIISYARSTGEMADPEGGSLRSVTMNWKEQ